MLRGQCAGEGDAGAGSLCPGRVRQSERRDSAAGGGDDNHRLTVRATVDGDGLAACRAGDRDNGGARGANRRDDGGLEVRAGINHNRLA